MGDVMWVVTGLAIIGVILNIKKRRQCFYVWVVTNTAWMIYDYSIGAMAQSALFAVYVVLALWGIYEWRAGK